VLAPPRGEAFFESVKKSLPEADQGAFAGALEARFDYEGLFSRTEEELAAGNAKLAEYYLSAAAAANRSGEGVPQAYDLEGSGGWMPYAVYFSMGKHHDYRGAFHRVKAPVLVIRGENDLQPEKVSRMFTAYFPNARLHTIFDAGHFPFSEQPKDFSSVVGKFLDKQKKEPVKVLFMESAPN
jgi:pimeloyl-ACP methyl ester carboxylesterase